MRKRTFGRVLDGIVSVVLASATCAAGAYGCGGASSAADNGADGGGSSNLLGEGFACSAPLPDVVTNLTPGVPVDYVELRRQSVVNPNYYGPDGGRADAGSPPTLTTLSAKGTPCTTAANHDACVAALAAAKLDTTSQGWGDGSAGGMVAPPTIDRDFLVYTRGDEVGIIRTKEELVAFFGAVDTLEEARLLLLANGYPFYCSAPGADPAAGWRKNADGSFELVALGGGCTYYKQIRLRVGVDGVVSIVSAVTSPVACGRRPAGLQAAEGNGAEQGIGAYFAEVAHLEAASVIAFRRLEAELRRFGAPESLLRRARRARIDEIRHARETAALARRFGAELAPVEVASMTERALADVAIENATEGCVRETYGALVAAFQARRADDPEVRGVFARIARDEARHAELSHDVATWLDAHLDATSRARVASARERALTELRDALERTPSDDVLTHAGMPTVREARALLAGLEREVLRARAA
jgi:hypothetical protein